MKCLFFRTNLVRNKRNLFTDETKGFKCPFFFRLKIKTDLDNSKTSQIKISVVKMYPIFRQIQHDERKLSR